MPLRQGHKDLQFLTGIPAHASVSGTELSLPWERRDRVEEQNAVREAM